MAECGKQPAVMTVPSSGSFRAFVAVPDCRLLLLFPTFAKSRSDKRGMCFRGLHFVSVYNINEFTNLINTNTIILIHNHTENYVHHNLIQKGKVPVLN
jgi:hypothetical protein